MRINWKRSLIFYIVIIVAAIVLFTVILPSGQKPTEIPLSEAITMSQDSDITKIVINGDTLDITAKDGTEYVTYKEANTSIYDIEGLNLENVEVDIKGGGGIDWGALFINILPFLFLGALIFFIFSQARGANSQAMSFGRSKARMFSGNTPTVTFDDVAGVEEAKQELQECPSSLSVVVNLSRCSSVLVLQGCATSLTRLSGMPPVLSSLMRLTPSVATVVPGWAVAMMRGSKP
jgi:cell division protease FtsH